MLKSYLVVALRNLRKDRGYTFINVFGLAAGIACCLLIALFVRHEWSYDRFHEHADRLYRAWGREDYGEGRTFFYTNTQWVLGATLEANLPEVEATVRVDVFENLVGPEDGRYTERIHMADAAFFDVFSFGLLQGDPATALARPGSVVLTPAMAEKYFPGEDPMGKTLPLQVRDAPAPFVVTGIAEAPPAASSIRYELLIPFEHVRERVWERGLTSWTVVGPETYVLLREGATGADVEAKLPAMIRSVVDTDAEHFELGLQPIADIHLNRAYPDGIEPTSDPAYSYVLGALAVLVLLIACINFVTLSVGQSTRRAREVGVRKSMGATRRALMQQFWGEALLLVGTALLAGVALAQVLLPLFNTLAGRELTLGLDAGLLAFLVALLLVVGLGAGSYPAVVLSGFDPIAVLKGRLRLAGDRSLLRRGLVVAQFTLSILMITAALFITRQLDYLKTTNLGFDKEQVVVLRTGVQPSEAAPIVERFRAALAGHGTVAGLATSAFALDEGWMQAGYTDPAGTWRLFNLNWTTHDYVETMGMTLAAGRSLAGDLATDSSKILVNEALVRYFGWGSPQEAVGKRLPGTDFPDHEIAGVVRDFHHESLRSEVAPVVLALHPRVILAGVSDVTASTSSNPKIAVRIRPEDLPAAMALLERTWTTVAPDLPFDYYFLDQAVDSRYRQEERLGRIAGTASLLSILIACLGLFGLATLTVAQRTKEIGVRKVLGASVPHLVLLLSKEFAWLVVVAFAIAVPLAYVAVGRWLADFAYRIDVGRHAGLFVLAGAAALGIALATVSYHAIRAALSDPVKALRYE